MQKNADAFRTISEVADDLSLPQHVLRFWETRFPQIRPLKRAGGRRYYRPSDILLLRTIRRLLYDDGYTIKGVQRLLKEQGAKGLGAAARPVDPDAMATDESLRMDAEPSSSLAPLFDEVVSTSGDGTMLSASYRESLEAALATVEECRRILDALRGTGP